MRAFWLVLSAFVELAYGQVSSSFPHDYPGKPSGDFSPEWQSYFQVTEKLPNISFPLSRNFAGNIPVDRDGHPNDTLFFWAWEWQNGSLTASAGENQDQPWGIWLNGGPGSSSMLGLFYENGPLHVANDFSLFANNQSWDHLADWIWIDQPVGVGFATADETGFVDDEDQMGHDFLGFLANLVKVFPSLKTRPLYITGESYAGTYIPYITKTYFGLDNPPVNLKKIAIGDGSLNSRVSIRMAPALHVIETYPQLIGYDPDVYNYFKEQNHLCGFDINLTYPQNGHFPTLNPPLPGGGAVRVHELNQKELIFRRALTEDIEDGRALRKREISADRLAKRDQWKRDLTGRANGTIDPFYKCDLFDEMIDYALNFSLPWKGNSGDGFDVYNIPDALDPEAPQNPGVFLNNDAVRAAIHAPTSKNWSSITYPFGSTNRSRDPSPAPMSFLTDLATNATNKSVDVVIYSGNDDSLVSHFGSEVVIQNTTFGGIQGFSRRPSTPWFDDEGQFAGIVHQERNWTYVLISGAGHLVPQQQPGRAFVLLREFILGSNTTGLVTNTSSGVSVVGGEVSTLGTPILPGQTEIFRGSGTTQSTVIFPSATVAAWSSFFATAGAAPTGTGASGGGTSGAAKVAIAGGTAWMWAAVLVVPSLVRLV